ncbi:MAG: hypothetical protein M3O02_07850 [Acidobacteriota bacterium]|nr:hypothetical protein [Acidobacteriota bacterium]
MTLRSLHLTLVAILSALAVHAPAEQPPIPSDAPTSACDFSGARSLDALRILAGTAPVPFVLSCPGYPGGRCNSPLTPGSPMRLASDVISVDHTEARWSCVFADSVPGWVPTDRLAPLPDTPAIRIADWLGWWRSGRDSAGIVNDRILITRSPADPRILHVSGRAFWYGINNNVHVGGINADAQARGPYLHIVEGEPPACILDLTYNPATHTFHAVDNALCGGMNVRFSGTWARFTPTARRHK